MNNQGLWHGPDSHCANVNELIGSEIPTLSVLLCNLVEIKMLEKGKCLDWGEKFSKLTKD